MMLFSVLSFFCHCIVGATLSGNQQQLVDIMDLYKNKKCSMAEVEALFKHWKLQYAAGSTAKSFKDKQVRGHPFMTSTKKITFLTPSPLSTCVHMGRTPLPLVDVHTQST